MRIGYLAMGFFTFYLITPLRVGLDKLVELSNTDQIILGVAGILGVLFWFDF